MEKSTMNRRKAYIDLLRILACFLVIACHTTSWGFDKQTINANWFFSTGWYIITKTAVPIFFMISGGLYLNKDYSYKQILKKIVTRIIIPLILFSALIYFRKNMNVSFQNFKSFVWAFLTCKILDYYWFLYALIGLYLMTPFLRKMVKNFENKDYLIFFTIWIVLQGIIPILENYTKLQVTKNFAIQITEGYIGYYVLGHYMFNVLDVNRNKKYMPIVTLIVAIVTIVISTIVTYIDYKAINFKIWSVFLDKLNYISIIIPSVCIVYIFKFLFENFEFSEKINKLIVAIASTTFGIYLIHGILLEKFKIIYNFISKYIYEFPAKVLAEIFAFLIMIVLVYILKKIPYLKKVI